MMRAGEVCEHQRWAHPIAGNGGYVLRGWPTPKTAGSGETPENWKRRAERVKNTPGSHGAPGMPLDVAVIWPTASATDYKGSSQPGQRRGQLTEPIEPGSGGRLNPEWVEMLMGFPAGWTLTDGQPLRDHSTHGSHRAPDHDSPTTEND